MIPTGEVLLPPPVRAHMGKRRWFTEHGGLCAPRFTHEHTNAQVLTVIPAFFSVIPAKAGMTVEARVGLTPE